MVERPVQELWLHTVATLCYVVSVPLILAEIITRLRREAPSIKGTVSLAAVSGLWGMFWFLNTHILNLAPISAGPTIRV